jgi:hypothetical protein
MTIWARLGPRCAGPLTVAVVRACADALARIDVPAPVVLALAAVAAATEALIAAQTAMRLVVTRRIPRGVLFTA